MFIYFDVHPSLPDDKNKMKISKHSSRYPYQTLGQRVIVIFIVIFYLLLLSPAHPARAERVRIAGSNAMYPLMTAVVERFTYETGERSPIVEATGTGGGIKIFCSGNGQRFPDIITASRPMTQAEKAFCAKNGVTAIHEIQFGFDGIVLAHILNGTNRNTFSIQLQELRMALGQSDHLPNNHHLPQQWSDIHPRLPNRLIHVFGPPSSSGTRETLEMLLAAGDKHFSFREDGRYINAADQENMIVQKLLIEPDAVGVFSYGFYQKNRNRLHALAINGIQPNYHTIVSGQYPLSRPLFIYIKRCSSVVCKNLNSFIEFLLDPLTSGPTGYLREYGLIALSSEKHEDVRQRALHFLRPAPHSQ
jgi:phosphate transport system substrate-binding protein